jgi:hypothetical protein
MVGELLKKLITDPAGGIAWGKKRKKMNDTLMVLVADWLVAAIAVMVAGTAVSIGSPFSGLATMIGGIAAIGVFIGGILLSLFGAFLLSMAVMVLGGKGKYWEGLSVLSYATWPLAVGSLVTAALLFGGIAGAFVGFLVLAVLGTSAVATLFRSVKELFSVDYITAFIALGVLSTGLTIAGIIASTGAAASLATAFLQVFTRVGVGGGIGPITIPGI